MVHMLSWILLMFIGATANAAAADSAAAIALTLYVCCTCIDYFVLNLLLVKYK